MDEHKFALQKLGEPVKSQIICSVYLITAKLPAETKQHWELSSKGKNPQKYAELRLFLEKGAEAWEARTAHGNSTTKPQQKTTLRHVILIWRIQNKNVSAVK